MRILHCLRAPVGGLFRHVLDLAGEQAAHGHDVGIIADSSAEDRLTAGKFAGLAPALTLGITRTPMSRQPGLGDFKAFRTVLAHARTLNLDVLHGHGAKGGAYARLSCRQLTKEGHNAKAFYTPHGGSLNFAPGTLQSRFFLKVERFLEKFTSCLIFESAYAAQIYGERVGPARVPLRIVPNGLQPADFEPREPAPDAADFLFVGELRKIKGVDTLLEALKTLNGERPATATIVGSGPEADRLKAYARDLGLSRQVNFAGALPARQAFGLGKVMVVPSRSESFPYVVLEAAAAGMPLVATSVGGIPEIVAGTDTALIPAGDPTVLADAMRRTLAEPELARAKSARLKASVQRKFTVHGMAAQILDFYAR